MSKKQTKKTFEVDVLVSCFITKEVTATNEEEAHKLAEDSIDLKTITQSWKNGDFEIECHGLNEDDDEDFS